MRIIDYGRPANGPAGRKIARLALVAAAIVLLFIFSGVAKPGVGEAHNVGGFCSGFVNESDLINDLDCRQTFVYDPGVGQLLSRTQLLSETSFWTSSGTFPLNGLPPTTWERPGFSNNFLWYSSVTSLTFNSGDTRRWTSCNRDPYSSGWAQPFGGPTHIGNLCPAPFQLPHGTVRGDFANNVTLSAFEFGGDYIIRACANFNPGPKATPIPTIGGDSFDDTDGNHVWDGGEPALPGVTFRLRRVSSLVGQASGIVATTTTGGSGSFEFALNGHGPGTYNIEEIVPLGMVATTPATKMIDIGFGVRDQAFDAGGFGSKAGAVGGVAELEEASVSSVEGNGPASVLLTGAELAVMVGAAGMLVVISWLAWLVGRRRVGS